eukprot:TRINITY_DN30165_c0_g1_i1.p1 TRINITY_DN30165_c0_g1~~TRINITY_DN30165_c0_g1_i1.p1  ORF type:complete len:115 (+),score=13.54 TRINITY_DN30165_c0_g1_i1:198-542(+)
MADGIGLALGGGRIGASTATPLRCVKCDFKVLRFAGHRWSPSVDYLFFRNFMPSLDRMREELLPEPEYAAYACQCAWQSVMGNVTELSTSVSRCPGEHGGSCDESIKWVVASHR